MPLDAPDLGHLADGKLQRCVRIHLPARPHDLCSRHLARDLFAMAEKGHRAAPVVGMIAAAGQGRIAHAPERNAIKPPGRGRRDPKPVPDQRDAAGGVVTRSPFVRPAFGRLAVGRVAKLQPPFGGKTPRVQTRDQDGLFFQHGAGQADWDCGRLRRCLRR